MGCSRLGDTLLVTCGTEHRYLADYENRVATGSVAVDPVVNVLFEGVSLWSLAGKLDKQVYSLALDLTLHGEAGEPSIAQVPAWAPPPSGADPDTAVGTLTGRNPVELAKTNRASLRTQMTVKPDQWVRIGCAPVSGDQDEPRCLGPPPHG